MAGFSQTGRLISLSVEGLDEDKLLLASFKGNEAMSRLFCFTLELLMEVTDPETRQPNDPVQFADVIGKNATISVTQSDDSPRYFNGIVSQFAITAVDVKFVHYEMEVVPWTWLLTRYADCKIFHNKAVGDIIQQVFSDRSQTDFKMSLTATYPTLEYCVQYRETDFNFISRLMEQFGIFYFFQHEDGKHTMVIADSSSAYEDCWPGHSSFGFNLAGGGLDEDDVVNAWSTEQTLKSGMCTLADYNFKTPSTSLVNQDPTVYAIGGNASFEVFDYPGLYINNSDGKAMAKLRMEEVEAGHLIARGSSVCRAFTSGTKFTLTAHPQDAMNGSYLLTEVQHTATVAGNYTGDGSAGDYSNHFSCILDSVPFRPARVTPKPFVQGPQTAVVIGTNPDSGSAESGDEIWVDSFGRVVVLFPWDRKNACSCWVRVSQDWAGQGWGSITIPRIGQEVIVSFLEGDPDRPIITGRVYNASQTVPYPLPANQTRSTFMTRSSKGGSASTYNELRFEDLKGKEQVFVRAQFDYDTQVLHDSREAIGNNRSLTVKVNQLESVGGDLHSTVTGGVFESVGKDVNTTVTGGIVETVGKDVNTTISGGIVESVAKDVNRAISGGLIESVSKDANSNITGNLNLKAGQAVNINAGTNLVESSGQAFSHNAGMSIDLKGGMTVTIEAGLTLTLVAGSNSIVIGPSGVSITGTMVMINSGGSASSANTPSPASPASPSSPASVVAPTAPDNADDGSTGTKLGSGSNAPAAAASGEAAAAASASQIAGPQLLAGQAAGVAGAAAGAAGAAEGAAAGAVSQAEQAAQQATQAAAQGAQQAAAAAQQAVTETEQAAQQVEQQAQQAVQQVTDQARQTYQQAQQAVQQAEQTVSQAAAQAQAQAQQALDQAKAEAMQAAQAGAQAVQDAQAKAEQLQQQAQAAVAQAQQQAQAAAAQAQQAAQAAAAQAQQAAQQVQQQAQQAVQQGEQAAQQAAAQAQQAAQQAQQQAQQAAQQAKAAAQQAQQQAQQAAQQVKQAASGAQQQAQQAAQSAQQSASQAISQATSGF